MNKNTYLLGILFLALSTLAGAFHSILLLQQEFSLVFLQSYATWYLISSIVALAGQLFLVRYFQSRQWKFVFLMSLISWVMYLIQSIIQYIFFITATRELTPEFRFVVLVTILCTDLFAAGLIFSKAVQNKLLKAIGILTFMSSTALLIAIFAASLGVSQMSAYSIIIWANVLSPVIPLLYIFVFKKEMKSVSYNNSPSRPEEILYYSAGTSGMIALVALLTVGGHLNTESYWNKDWQKRGPEEARKLAQRFETRMFINNNHDTLHYLFIRPLDYDSTQKYPMVTCLHGGPTRIAGNVEVAQPAALLSEYENRKKYPAFIFVPQGRPGVLWGGIPGIPSLESLVFEAMDALETEFSVDKTRRYVAGGSGGGYGTWHFICTHPDRFAAAIPMCGVGNVAMADKIVSVPVWAFHGDADRNVPVTGSRNMIEAIRKAGGNPKYNEFPNVGHNVWPEVYKTEGVLDWLFQQRRWY